LKFLGAAAEEPVMTKREILAQKNVTINQMFKRIRIRQKRELRGFSENETLPDLSWPGTASLFSVHT
jgi:hypothetical protein